MSQFREDFLKALAEVAQVKAVHMTPREWSGKLLTQEQVDAFVETTLQRFRDED